MNLFDIILLAIFCGSVFLGLYKGLVVTSINIGSFFLTILMMMIITPMAKEIVSEHIENTLIVSIISLVLSYLLSSFASGWLGKRIKEGIEKHTGGLIDRTLGLWLGAIRGYVLCLFVFLSLAVATSSSYVGAKNYLQMFSNIVSEHYPKWLKRAYFFPFMQGSTLYFGAFMEGGIVSNYLESISLPASQVKDSQIIDHLKSQAQKNISINSNINNPVEQNFTDKQKSIDELQRELSNNGKDN